MSNQSPIDALRQDIQTVLESFEVGQIVDYEINIGFLLADIMPLVTAYAATVEREARQDELYGLKYTLADRKDEYLELLINTRLAALQGQQDEADANRTHE
jgi:hypothetical protein